MPVHDELGKRMKSFYEGIPQTKLMRRCPVIIRIDGKAFHTFTKGFKEPFDNLLRTSMAYTTRYLCENIQGCVLGYTQSDEISLLLVDYAKLNTDAWFDYEVQKICSIAASIATFAFNQTFSRLVTDYEKCEEKNQVDQLIKIDETKYTRYEIYMKACEHGAMFDARCFNIPKEEVTNYFYWRQADATRNSIQLVGQAHFSHKQLLNKTCNQIQDMLLTQKDVNWNNFETSEKRGTCVIKDYFYVDNKGCFVGDKDSLENTDDFIKRTYWKIDGQIPIFKGEGRDYIEKLVFINE